MEHTVLKLETGQQLSQRKLIQAVGLGYALSYFALELARWVIVGSFHPLGLTLDLTLNGSLLCLAYYARKGGNLQLASKGVITLLCVIFIAFSYLGGGLQAPNIVLGITTPLLAFLVGGVRSSIVAALVIITTIIGIYLHTLSHGSYGLTPMNSDYRSTMQMIYLVAVVGITTWTGWYFTRVNNELLKVIKREASHDYLTGLLNRRSMDSALENEFNRAKRHEKWISILMIDIDYFKKINDSYRHKNGDLCLVQVSDILRRSLQRPSDMVGRYGGEEFLCLLADTNPAGAQVVAENIRRTIEQASFMLDNDEEIKMTVSIGIASVVCREEVSLGAIVHAADEMLYAAKNKGRNCTAAQALSSVIHKAG